MKKFEQLINESLDISPKDFKDGQKRGMTFNPDDNSQLLMFENKKIKIKELMSLLRFSEGDGKTEFTIELGTKYVQLNFK